MKRASGTSRVSFNYRDKVESELASSGNGAHAYLPKKWLEKYKGKKLWVFAGIKGE